MPGNTSFTEEDEENLAYMFAQDVRLFIKFLGERCAKDPDNRVKYCWSDKQLEYVRNLYTSASFHQRLCDYLSPQKDRADKEIESSLVVDGYVGERYPERASRRGKSASPKRGRGQVTGKSTVGRNPYPRVTVERNPYPSQPSGVADEPLYSSEPLGQSYNPEQFLTVSDTSWIEPEFTFEVIPPSPDLQFQTGVSRSSSGSSTTLVSRETSVELPIQFPQPQIPQIVGQSWENTSGFTGNEPWSTSWNNGPVDQKRKRGHEEGPAGKKRRT